MSSNQPTQNTSETSTLYFAFGSNLSTTQMAARCPLSRLVGVGQLTDYAWLINGRGYANVVACSRPASTESKNIVMQRPSASVLSYTDAPYSPPQAPALPSSRTVWGLLYALPPEDEARLDRAEGVPGCYGKEWLSVRYWSLDASKGTKTSKVAAQFSDVRDPFMPVDGEPAVDDHVAEEARRSQLQDAPRSSDVADTSIVPDGRADVSTPPRQVTALVYVDRFRVTNGVIQEEYVMRMRRACAEAEERGLPADWLGEVIRPWLG